MGRTRRGFTPEYKDEAVKLVINTGRTVARELGVNEATLGRWVNSFRVQAAAGEGGQGGLRETKRAETSLFFAQEASDTNGKRSS